MQKKKTLPLVHYTTCLQYSMCSRNKKITRKSHHFYHTLNLPLLTEHHVIQVLYSLFQRRCFRLLEYLLSPVTQHLHHHDHDKTVRLYLPPAILTVDATRDEHSAFKYFYFEIVTTE